MRCDFSHVELHGERRDFGGFVWRIFGGCEADESRFVEARKCHRIVVVEEREADGIAWGRGENGIGVVEIPWR